MLGNYNEIPSNEEIATSEKKLDSYRQEFMESIYDYFFIEFTAIIDCGKVRRFDMRLADNTPEKIVRQDVEFRKWPRMLRKSMRDS